MAARPEYINYATVERVVDGDTYDLKVALAFGIFANQRIRLHGFDTPETYRPRNEAELKHGLAAKQFVINQIEGKTVIIKTYKIGVYGRFDADVWLLDEDRNPVKSLADLLGEHDYHKYDEYPETA